MPSVRRPAPAPAAARPAARPVARAARSAPVDPVLARIEAEHERAEARREAQSSMSGMPFRFFCPVGETREFIVVDDRITFVRNEHNLKDSRGKWSIYAPCISEHANCPICMSNPDKPAYFAMYLTVIDLTPYTNKDGIEVPWSKKLLVVKSNQQKKFTRKQEQHGSLRGALFSTTRDGEKEAAIGSDIELIEFVEEEALNEYYNTYEKDGKVIEIVGSEPFNYEELLPEQSEEMLAAIVGGHVHNHDSHNRNIGRGGSRPGSSGDGWQDAPPRTSRPAARGPAPAARGPAPRQAPPAARGPAPRAAARQAPVQEDYVEGYEEAEGAEGEAPWEAPAAPARTAARGPAPRAAARPAPRAAEPDDEPQRPAASLAARRQQLRR